MQWLVNIQPRRLFQSPLFFNSCQGAVLGDRTLCRRIAWEDLPATQYKPLVSDLQTDETETLPIPPYHKLLQLLLLVNVVKEFKNAGVEAFWIGNCVRSWKNGSRRQSESSLVNSLRLHYTTKHETIDIPEWRRKQSRLAWRRSCRGCERYLIALPWQSCRRNSAT